MLLLLHKNVFDIFLVLFIYALIFVNFMFLEISQVICLHLFAQFKAVSLLFPPTL